MVDLNRKRHLQARLDEASHLDRLDTDPEALDVTADLMRDVLGRMRNVIRDSNSDDQERASDDDEFGSVDNDDPSSIAGSVPSSDLDDNCGVHAGIRVPHVMLLTATLAALFVVGAVCVWMQ